jgi:hypothetical protein
MAGRRLTAYLEHHQRPAAWAGYRGRVMTDYTPELAICSAKGCRRPAETAIVWRNPALHHGDRVKQWVACPDHLDYLSSFLARRDFLLRTEPLEPIDPEPGI